MNNKALVVGINKYPTCPLAHAARDAQDMARLLERHADGSRNFSVIRSPDELKKDVLRQKLRKLFLEGDGETALFYFSGHGGNIANIGYIVTSDFTPGDEGISVAEILASANESKFRNRVVILDCCSAGMICQTRSQDCGAPHIATGVTVLAACGSGECAVEGVDSYSMSVVNGHGLFSRLVLAALEGGAASVNGEVSPGGVYAAVDRSLGPWDQRPLFMANVSGTVVLRKVNPPVELAVLRGLTDYFAEEDSLCPLDPSYEFTNDPNVKHELVKPYANPDHVRIFKNLQRLERVGLVVPVGEEHLYFEAMRRGNCRLTPLGRHYWRLAKENRI